MKTLVVSKDMGGQALLTNDIQNYPGFTNIGGFELMSLFEQQAKTFGAEFLYDEVVEVKPVKEGFAINTPNHQFTCAVVILAFGKTPRDLGVKGEQELKGRGVSYCAVCDGPLFKKRPIAIVGTGEPAVDALSLLSELASKVYAIHRGEKLTGDEETVARLSEKTNIEFLRNSEVTEIRGEDAVTGLIIRNVKDGSTKAVNVDGVFVEMGYIAKTDFVKHLVELNSSKEIVVDKFCATSHPGIYAAGDVTDTPFKQVVVSGGQGCIAALSAINYLMKLRGRPAVKADWKSVTLTAK
jgi:thioredoxin reductase (NADPH)